MSEAKTIIPQVFDSSLVIKQQLPKLPQTLIKPSKDYSLHKDDYYGLDFGLEASRTDLSIIPEPEHSPDQPELDDIVLLIQQNTLIRGIRHNIVEHHQPEPTTSPEQHQHRSLKKPVNALKNIDYSEIFDVTRLQQGGLLSWRIENLVPVMQDTPDIYCPKDCYLILSSYNTFSSSIPPDSDPRIWSWIGVDAEMDKRFCCALFAVALRDSLNLDCRITRIEQGDNGDHGASDEEILFLNVLRENNTPFTLVNEDMATESALYAADSPRFDSPPPRLYKVLGAPAKDIRLLLVNPVIASLLPNSTYLLDHGLEMYQWNGASATLNHISKLRMFVQRINHRERVGRAVVEEIYQDEDQVSLRFLELLGGANDEEDTDHMHVDDESTEISALLYRIAQIIPQNMDESLVQPGSCAAYSRQDFSTQECYILDCGPEVFLWIGSASPPAIRLNAPEFLARVVPLRKRPQWLGLHKISAGQETEVFKSRFPEWQSVGDAEWIQSRDEAAIALQSKPSKIQLDVRALYNNVATGPPDLAVIAGCIKESKKSLEKLSCFVYSKGRFVTLPARDHGHFNSKDTYIFLCVRKSDDKDPGTRVSLASPQSMEVIESSSQEHTQQANEAFIPTNQRQYTRPRSFTAGEPTIASRHPDQTLIRLSSVSRSSLSRSRSQFQDNNHPPSISSQGFSRRSSNDAHNCNTGTSYESLVRQQSQAWLSRKPTTLQSKVGVSSDGISGSSVPPPNIMRSSTIKPNRRSTISSDTRPSSTNEASSFKPPNCTVYYWSGKNSSKLALPTFKFATLVQMHALISDMYDNCPPPQVVYCESGKEPVPFLACFDNEIIVHYERQNSSTIARYRSYRIWVDSYGTTRALYNDNSAGVALDERFVYVMPGYMWLGKCSIGKEAAILVARKIACERYEGSELQVVDDGFETPEFWDVWTGTGKLELSQSCLSDSGGVRARLLKCSCSLGYFAIQELDSRYGQCDLTPDSCVIIDAGPAAICFLWVGAEASDVVLKLSRKSLQVWFGIRKDLRNIGVRRDHPSGCGFLEGDVWVVEEAREPLMLTRLFKGWEV